MSRGHVWNVYDRPVAPAVPCLMCSAPAPAIMAFCAKCWFKLPQNIRTAIFRAYTPMLEITGRGSDAFNVAISAARAWVSWTANGGQEELEF